MATVTATAGSALPGNSRSRRPGRARQRLVILSMMAPALVGIAVFFVYPLIAVVYFSFTKYNLLTPPVWFGLGNYRYLLHDPQVRQAAGNTLWLVVVMVPAQVVFGLATAALLVRVRRGAGVYRTLFYLPALVPPVAGTLAFVYLLKPGTGPVNQALGLLGIDGPLWFNSPTWAKPSLTLLALWSIGNTMVIFLASLLDVPASLHEAAALDGAGAIARFRHVTLPSIAPVVLFSTITGVIATLQYFTEAVVAASAASGQATVGGGAASNFGYPNGSTATYPLWLYNEFHGGLLGYASALSVVLFLVSFAVIAVLLRRARTFAGDPA